MRENSIGLEIRTLSNLLKRKVFEIVPPLEEDDRLTDMQGLIVDFLYDHQGKSEIFQRDIEAKFSIRRSTASGILSLMEERGIILREPVSYDARLKRLVLTPKAIRIHEAVSEKIGEVEALISKGLTDDEIRQFCEVIKKIKSNLG